jgi:hypothetical protein
MSNTSSPNYLWYVIGNVNKVYSPVLLVYPDRIEENIRKMVRGKPILQLN